MRQIKGQINLFSSPPAVKEVPKELPFDILTFIHIGSKNAIKRKWLCIKTRLKDRVMRDLLHEARKRIPVINLQNGKGYFIPDMNEDEDVKMLVRWVRQEQSRIKESQMIVDVAKKTLENCGVDWR